MNVRPMGGLTVVVHGARRELHRSRLLGLCLLLGVLVGCGRTPEQQEGGSTQAVVVPHLTTIAKSTYAVAFSAAPSGGIATDAVTPRASGGARSTVNLTKSQSLSVIGWAFPASQRGGCSAVGLALDAKHVFPATYGYARADVATYFKDASRTYVGYSIVVPAKEMGVGSHHGYVVCMESPQIASRSYNPLTITVR